MSYQSHSIVRSYSAAINDRSGSISYPIRCQVLYRLYATTNRYCEKCNDWLFCIPFFFWVFVSENRFCCIRSLWFAFKIKRFELVAVKLLKIWGQNFVYMFRMFITQCATCCGFRAVSWKLWSYDMKLKKKNKRIKFFIRLKMKVNALKNWWVVLQKII